MAKQLVSAMTGEFEPENYRDEYREALMKVIEAKMEGHEAVVAEPVEETGNLIDLMAALEASVKATKAARDDTPVSVADAKKARASRSAEAETEEKPAAKKAATRRPAKAADADEAEEPAAASGGRSRRRKSA